MLLRPLLRRSVVTFKTTATSPLLRASPNSPSTTRLRAGTFYTSSIMAANASDSAGAIAQAQQAEQTTSTAAAPTHNAPADAQPA
jgi:hypothetical protein